MMETKFPDNRQTFGLREDEISFFNYHKIR